MDMVRKRLSEMDDVRELNVNIPDHLYKRLKVRIAELYNGGHKGDLQRIEHRTGIELSGDFKAGFMLGAILYPDLVNKRRAA